MKYKDLMEALQDVPEEIKQGRIRVIRNKTSDVYSPGSEYEYRVCECRIYYTTKSGEEKVLPLRIMVYKEE